MEKLINKIKREIRELTRDAFYVSNAVSINTMQQAIRQREEKLRELE